MSFNDWHLRLTLTSKCNLLCNYCNPDGLREKFSDLSVETGFKILESAKDVGINRVHWTGGEPTCSKNLISLVRYANKLGFVDQAITSNGTKQLSTWKELIENGIKRVNISLDTTNREHYKVITGYDKLENVKNLLDYLINQNLKIIKVNTVVMKDNVDELQGVYDLIRNLISINKISWKLICIAPNNPVMLSNKGQDFFKLESVHYGELINKLNSFSNYKQSNSRNVIGDNPNSEFGILDNIVPVEVLAMSSWDYKCGGAACKKLRITPFGQVTACLQHPLIDINTLSKEEICEVFSSLILNRNVEANNKNIFKNHYSPNIGQVRFGLVGKSVSIQKFL